MMKKPLHQKSTRILVRQSGFSTVIFFLSVRYKKEGSAINGAALCRYYL